MRGDKSNDVIKQVSGKAFKSLSRELFLNDRSAGYAGQGVACCGALTAVTLSEHGSSRWFGVPSGRATFLGRLRLWHGTYMDTHDVQHLNKTFQSIAARQM